MAFKASSIILVTAYEEIKREAANVKRRAQRLHDQSADGSISADLIINFVQESVASKSRMQTLAAVPGLAAYAQSQESDGSYDVAAEYSAMIGGINSCIAWVDANFPKDAGGFLLKETMDADGTIAPRSFTTASTNGLRAVLSSLVALID